MVRYNFATGDIELIEDNSAAAERAADAQSPTHIWSSSKPSQLPHLNATSTADVARKKLETQLSSLMRHKAKSSMSHADLLKAANALVGNGKGGVNTNHALLRQQIDKHSFRDLELMPIAPRNQQAAPVVLQNKYTVSVMKRPSSMHWLRHRRLPLFVQSELYNEFKLAAILAQFGLFSHDMSGQ